LHPSSAHCLSLYPTLSCADGPLPAAQGLKAEPEDSVQHGDEHMGSTLGACGDLNRNILAPAVPYKGRKDSEYCQSHADKIALLLAPRPGPTTTSGWTERR